VPSIGDRSKGTFAEFGGKHDLPTIANFRISLVKYRRIRDRFYYHSGRSFKARFGLHNLRHSLSHWLVNKAKVEPKTVQSILRHSRIQTTLDIYAQGDGDETRAAQGTFLKALGMASEMIQ
jgi:integrase